MSRWRVTGGRPLRGRVRVPGDLQLGQQALLWAALGEGPSVISGLSSRADHVFLCDALRAMGVPIASTAAGVRVMGGGLRGLRAPAGALQAGDSASTLELLTALLAAQHFGTRVEARGAALRHSLRTLVAPLRARGAHVAGKQAEDGDVHGPVAVAPLLPDEALAEAEIEIPGGDPATKLALLVSGLYVPGATVIAEGMMSVDHAERALMRLGAGIQTLGAMTLLDRTQLTASWPGFEWQIPGDFSLACWLLAAALAVPGSDLTLEGVGVNRTRSAFLEILRQAGADLSVTPKGDVAGDEPVADLRVRSARLRGGRVAGELAFRVSADAAALLALAPCLGGKLSLRDLAPRAGLGPEGTRRAAQLVRAAGFECTDYADGFDLHPTSGARTPPQAAQASERSDDLPEHRLLTVVLALSADGETAIEHGEAVHALYPGLGDVLAALGAEVARDELT
jgi:3-phosphoshikimate 1-carboxyvinyltransferase